jgi:hypothetical protein
VLRIILGVPGSGKSYYAVNYLKQFIKYDKLYQTLLLDPSVMLVTNIEDIKVPHLKWEDYLESGMLNIDKTRQYMKENQYKRGVFIVDEAQRTLSGLKDNEKYFFFEYHRHLGLDIFLIVQTLKALPARLVELTEFVIEAMPRTYAILGFKYQMKDSKTGLVLYTKVIKIDQEVFKVYKSFEVDEDSKAKPKKVILIRWVSSVGLLVAVIAFGMFGAKAGIFFNQNKEIKQIKGDIQISEQKKWEKQGVKKSGKGKGFQEDKQEGEKEIEFDYVIIENHKTNLKPHGKIKGVATVGDKSYIMYR